MNSVEILGVRVNPVTKPELIENVARAMDGKKTSEFLLAMNPIKIILAQKNPDFREYIRTATCVFPDAVGLIMALRLLRGIKVKRLPGFELLFDILEMANQRSLKVTLIGASPASMAIAEKKLKLGYPNIRFVGIRHGYFSNEERDQVIENVIADSPDVLIVGMGVLKQESLIVEIRRKKAIPVCMTVGGSFDVISNHSPRAPRWLCAIGLEWLYRLIRQPFRWRAMLPIPVFALQVIQTYLKNIWATK
jgi:N-acetylglucosaminyldiphosphoundecaprenol N-acetyl-beta-D-mannosaminyltransferase